MDTKKTAWDIQEKYNQIQKDPDRSKVLAIHAMLGFDDGETYTEQDYQRAITFLEEGMAINRDSSDGIFTKAIQWCKIRSISCETN